MTRSIEGRNEMESILRDERKQVSHQVLVQLDVPVIMDTQKHIAPSNLSSILFAYFEPDATHDMLDDAITGPVV